MAQMIAIQPAIFGRHHSPAALKNANHAALRNRAQTRTRRRQSLAQGQIWSPQPASDRSHTLLGGHPYLNGGEAKGRRFQFETSNLLLGLFLGTSLIYSAPIYKPKIAKSFGGSGGSDVRKSLKRLGGGLREWAGVGGSGMSKSLKSFSGSWRELAEQCPPIPPSDFRFAGGGRVAGFGGLQNG